MVTSGVRLRPGSSGCGRDEGRGTAGQSVGQIQRCQHRGLPLRVVLHSLGIGQRGERLKDESARRGRFGGPPPALGEVVLDLDRGGLNELDRSRPCTWLNSYDSEGSLSGPIAWHRDFADARNRLREWVSTSGTRLDRDRATRQTAWPGEPPIQPAPERGIFNPCWEGDA